MDKTKEIRTQEHYVETGYMDEDGEFVLHSFDDKPALIWNDGTKNWFKDDLLHRDNNEPAIINHNGIILWYDHGNRYWFIENMRYNSLDEIYEKYKDKIISISMDYDLSQILSDMEIDFIILYYGMDGRDYYLILDDIDRNEVILRYG